VREGGREGGRGLRVDHGTLLLKNAAACLRIGRGGYKAVPLPTT